MVSSIDDEYEKTCIPSAVGSPRPEVMKKFHAQLVEVDKPWWYGIIILYHLHECRP